MGKISDVLSHAWSVFTDSTRPDPLSPFVGASYGTRPDRQRPRYSNERTIISSIYTRLSIDVSSIAYRHVRLDETGRYSEDMDSLLQNCLTVEANVDQWARAFRQDMAQSLFDKGHIAVVPDRTTQDPSKPGSFDIMDMRVGEIVAWMPQHVRVSLYNDETGRREEVLCEKRRVAIVENPFYSVMNEPNSTLQRLVRKLNLLDIVDEQSSSGKLDILIQLPYTIKSDARRQQAEQRRRDVEVQLSGSKYGIAYVDGTEKITQLNRPSENNLLKQVEYLTNLLYTQLGLTPEIMDGTASEQAMLNYNNRTIEPIADAIVEAMRRTFLTKTARTQKQSILYFRDPFKLVPVEKIAEIADKLTRNEIVSSNEMRGVVGLRPSKDPKADELRNSNMPEPTEAPVKPPQTPPEGERQNGT